MTRGILVVAHDTDHVSYSTLAAIAATLAKKNLNLPVSLITDGQTLVNLKSNLFFDLFDKVILTEKPQHGNVRAIDGKISDTFLNWNRADVFNLTPYDHTLLIDSDLLIFTDRFNQYWDIDQSVIVCETMLDSSKSRLGFNDIWLSNTGPLLRWATSVMFKKNQESQAFFNLIKHVKENYMYYSDIYNFTPFQYRNDISFTLAEHIMYASSLDRVYLPSLAFVLNDEEVLKIDNKLVKLILKNDNSLLTIRNSDVHVMNKSAILNFKKELL
jgi:protein associated with RNAse G/E